MKKLLFFGIITTTIFLANIYLLGANSTVSAQTVPTRTSTPEPTATNDSGNGNNGGNPTDTPAAPTATPTETPIPVTAVNTPAGGYYPTAEPCSNQPTVIASNNTNVRSGPDTSYAIVGQIVFLEVRPILGRAQNANWWLISLADGTTGWVFDEVVTVNGYIDIVPIMTEPTSNGEIWNPTPNPSCTVTPTPLPTETPIPTHTPNSTMPAESITMGRTTVEEVPTETAVSATEPPTLVPQPTRVTDPTATPLPAVAPIDPPNTGDSSNWLFIGALGLLLVGGIVFIVKRN